MPRTTPIDERTSPTTSAQLPKEALPPGPTNGETTWTAISTAVAAYVQNHGAGNWRVRDDLVDTTLDTLLDSLLDSLQLIADSVLGYAIGICERLRSSTPTLALDRRRIVPLRIDAADELAEPLDEGRQREVYLDLPIRVLPDDLSRFGLTAHEEVVIRFCQTTDSWHQIAKQTGMTRRDARNRAKRAAKKIRRILGDFAPPLNKG